MTLHYDVIKTDHRYEYRLYTANRTAPVGWTPPDKSALLFVSTSDPVVAVNQVNEWAWDSSEYRLNADLWPSYSHLVVKCPHCRAPGPSAKELLAAMDSDDAELGKRVTAQLRNTVEPPTYWARRQGCSFDWTVCRFNNYIESNFTGRNLDAVRQSNAWNAWANSVNLPRVDQSVFAQDSYGQSFMTYRRFCWLPDLDSSDVNA
jgi:hypothetical protein